MSVTLRYLTFYRIQSEWIHYFRFGEGERNFPNLFLSELDRFLQKAYTQRHRMSIVKRQHQ